MAHQALWMVSTYISAQPDEIVRAGICAQQREIAAPAGCIQRAIILRADAPARRPAPLRRGSCRSGWKKFSCASWSIPSEMHVQCLRLGDFLDTLPESLPWSAGQSDGAGWDREISTGCVPRSSEGKPPSGPGPVWPFKRIAPARPIYFHQRPAQKTPWPFPPPAAYPRRQSGRRFRAVRPPPRRIPQQALAGFGCQPVRDTHQVGLFP